MGKYFQPRLGVIILTSQVTLLKPVEKVTSMRTQYDGEIFLLRWVTG